MYEYIYGIKVTESVIIAKVFFIIGKFFVVLSEQCQYV